MRENGIGYTLTVGSNTITINGGSGATSFFGGGWYAAPDGVMFQSGVNPAISSRPQAHGSYMDGAYRDGISGTFTLYNFGATAALRQSQQDAMMTALDGMLGDDGITGTLTWVPQDGSSARKISGLQLVQPPVWQTVAGTVKSVSFVVQSERPFAETSSAYNTDTTSFSATGGGWSIPLTLPVTITAGGAGQSTVENDGSVDAFPEVRVYGPINAFTLTLSASGYTTRQLSFPSGSIASGDYWAIDLLQRTVTFGSSTTSMISSLDLSSSTWFGFPPGNSTLQLTGSGYDTTNTKARVLMVSAWA